MQLVYMSTSPSPSFVEDGFWYSRLVMLDFLRYTDIHTHAYIATLACMVYSNKNVYNRNCEHMRTCIHPYTLIMLRELQTAPKAVSPCLGLISAVYSVQANNTRAHMHAHTTQSRAYAHTPHNHTCTCTHTHIHTHPPPTHNHMHKHMHTHTHTHIYTSFTVL